jgi:hypothetical protein
VASTLSAVGSDEPTGSATSSDLREATYDFTVYFAIEFDEDLSAEGTYGDTPAGPGGAYVSFATPAIRRCGPVQAATGKRWGLPRSTSQNSVWPNSCSASSLTSAEVVACSSKTTSSLAVSRRTGAGT